MVSPAEVNRELVRYIGRTMSRSRRSPLKRFIGTLVSWDVDHESFTDIDGQAVPYVVFNFDRVQVLELQEGEDAYLQSDAELALKYSTVSRSTLGFFINSANKALGLPREESDLDALVGKTWEVWTEKYNWGKIPHAENADEDGNVWGDIWKCRLVQAASSQQAGPPAGVAGASTTPPPAQQGAQPPTPSTAEDQDTGAPTAEAVALDILNGRTLAEAVPLLVSNPTIQADSTLINGIMRQTWIAEMISKGNLASDEGGRFRRVG